MKTTSDLEPLEARIAPALLINMVTQMSATWIDVDGDLVTLKVNKPILDMGDFTEDSPKGLGEIISSLNFADDATNGLDITITAKPQDLINADGIKEGDGRVDLGQIDSAGFDLGKVSIAGDLAKVVAGSGAGVALKSLTVASLGERQFVTGAPDLVSTLNGSVGQLVVKGNVRGAFVDITGTLGSVTIGGSLIGGAIEHAGQIQATGAIGPVKIGGDLVGGGGKSSGNVHSSAGGIASVSVGGTIFGGGGDISGVIDSFLLLGSVKVGGDLIGGGGDFAGGIESSSEAIGSVTIGGSVIGKAGRNSATIVAGTGITTVKIGGDIIGGSTSGAGGVSVSGKIKSLTIGGALRGGSADFTGAIDAGDLGSVKIGHDVIGGDSTGAALRFAGAINSDQRIADLTVGGSIIAGTVSGGGSLFLCGGVGASDDIGKLTVKGSLVGNSAAPVTIVARGQAAPRGSSDVALGSLTVGGRVEWTNITLGYNTDLTPANADAQAGAIRVGGDWIASNLSAGINPGNGFLGDSGDAKIAAGAGIKDTAVTSRIASITIGGGVLGTTDGIPNVKHFGIVAEEIAAFKSNGTALPLKSGANNDTFALFRDYPVGPSLSTGLVDGFAVHVNEV